MPVVRLKDNEPFESGMRRFKRTIEKIGKLFFPYMGGLMICVCKKIVYAKSSKKQKKIPIKNFVPT